MTRYESVCALRRAVENLLEVLRRHPPPLAVRTQRGRGIDDHVLGTQRRQMVLDLEVAERPEQAGRDRDRGGRRHRVLAPVEADEPHDALFIPGGEPRRHAGALAANDGPLSGRGAVGRQRTAPDIVGGQRLRVNAIGEPAGVRHLVGGVDVLRADVGRAIARLAEQVVQQIRRQADVPCLDVRGVLRLGIPLERVVREEPRALRAEVGCRHDGRRRQQCECGDEC